MEQAEKNHQKNKTKNEPNLKGTAASVSILGGLILISWLGAFFLFLSRGY